ncbi:hypothetical protein WISP_78379 [Willisornis vidua]|uniref:Uncharacterized protein n=1 Tax=Willisornis vidua TaxID=1566151 RepID=A0ABQ9DAW3_9PASS|nr:hypothetical protein WISP_78379 [Willisornis vidua]
MTTVCRKIGYQQDMMANLVEEGRSIMVPDGKPDQSTEDAKKKKDIDKIIKVVLHLPYSTDKAEEFHAFFALVFTTDDGPRWSQDPGLEDCDCEKHQLPVNSEIVQDLLHQLDPYKSVGPGGIHPRILNVLADVITKPLLMIF